MHTIFFIPNKFLKINHKENIFSKIELKKRETSFGLQLPPFQIFFDLVKLTVSLKFASFICLFL